MASAAPPSGARSRGVSSALPEIRAVLAGPRATASGLPRPAAGAATPSSSALAAGVADMEEKRQRLDQMTAAVVATKTQYERDAAELAAQRAALDAERGALQAQYEEKTRALNASLANFIPKARAAPGDGGAERALGV